MKVKKLLSNRLILGALFTICLIGAIILLSHYSGEKPESVTMRITKKPIDTYPRTESTKVNNIILLIGDGMGLGPIVSARISSQGPEGRLYFERMPVTGLINTHATNRLVTDSAASATAMATGYKTNNRMIGITPSGKKPITILEALQKKGKGTGLVAISRITHATTASFASHVKSRYNETRIAQELIANRVNILMGGGRSFFLPQSALGSKRTDEIDLLDGARQLGYTVISRAEQLEDADTDHLLGLFSLSHLTPEKDKPSLAAMTTKAIELLKKRSEGFFLMVEGSGIDWSGEDNKKAEMIQRILLFDEAVKVALDFAMADRETLVLVTADHDTGGLSITGGSQQLKSLTLEWVSNDHTGESVPIYAFGPGALRFTGVHDNTEIPKIIAQLTEVDDFPEELNPPKNHR